MDTSGPTSTGRALLSEMLSGELSAADYDPDVVALVKKHLDVDSIRARAGQELGADLIKLAQDRNSTLEPQ